MKSEPTPFIENERNWAHLHQQAVHRLESSMVHLYKARLSMVGAMDQRQIRDPIPYDPFLPTLKELQSCLLRRYTFHTKNTEHVESDYSAELSLSPDALCQNFIRERFAAEAEEKGKFQTYIAQLENYAKERTAILHTGEDTILTMAQAELEMAELSPADSPDTSPEIPLQQPESTMWMPSPRFTTSPMSKESTGKEDAPWLAPPMLSSSPMAMDPAAETSSESYAWFPTEEPFLTSPLSSTTSPTYTPANQSSSPSTRTTSPVIPSSAPLPQTTTPSNQTPPPWIAPPLQRNPRRSIHSLSSFPSSRYTASSLSSRSSSWRKPIP